MIGIPVKVKNVSIYPYLGIGPIGPVVEPVLTGASGTYSIGTLITSVFYNLNLTGGKTTGKLGVHQKYIAMGEYEDGGMFTTVWMYCTEADTTPEFGRTINMIGQGNEEAGVADAAISIPKYIKLGPLTNITATLFFPSPAIGQMTLIENGVGNIIGTKVGTPHEMGVEVISGTRVNRLSAGMHNIMITGKTKDGQTYTLGNTTVVGAGEPAVFLKLFNTSH